MSDDGLFDPSRNETPPAVDLATLRQLLQSQANTIVAVGTGGERIQVVDTRWQRDARTLNASFRRLGLQPLFPWVGLWDWHGFYSQNLGTYHERRAHVRELTQVALAELDEVEARGGVHDPAANDDTPSWRQEVRTPRLGLIYSSLRTRAGVTSRRSARP